MNQVGAGLIWSVLSVLAAVKMIRREGSGIRHRVGVSRGRQFIQMLGLAWFRNVTPLDYYQFRYFQAPFRKRAPFFLPAVRLGRIERKLNHGRDTDLLDHKLRAYLAFRDAGIPTIEIVEVFFARGRKGLGRSRGELARFLGQELFVKPINGFGGSGVSRWAYEGVTRCYRNGGRVVAEADLWEYFEQEADEMEQGEPERYGRLVQPLVRNHPEVASLSKAALNTLRINTLCDSNGRIELFAAALRMALGDAIEDTSAGIVSNVNLRTGALGPGASPRFAEQTFPHHPDTGARLEGLVLPGWNDCLQLALQAHAAFPQFPFVGWDIALTPNGPLLVEANSHPRLDVMQAEANRPLAATALARVYEGWVGSA